MPALRLHAATRFAAAFAAVLLLGAADLPSQEAPRQGFWWALGAGITAGSGWTAEERSPQTLGQLSAGGTVTSRLQVGVTSFGVTAWLRDSEPTRGVLVGTFLGGLVRWHPTPLRGAFVALSAGRVTVALPEGPVSGLGGFASTGWDFRLDRLRSLAPFVMLAVRPPGLGAPLVPGIGLALTGH